MKNKKDWYNLQASMNNFKIDDMMSYTDIQTKLRIALKHADKEDPSYPIVKKIAERIKALGSQNDFIKDNKHNRKLFHDVHTDMENLIGMVKIDDQVTQKLDALYKKAYKKEPKAMKQFNLRAHKQDHMSCQQAMLQAMGAEVNAEKKNK